MFGFNVKIMCRGVWRFVIWSRSWIRDRGAHAKSHNAAKRLKPSWVIFVSRKDKEASRRIDEDRTKLT